MLRKIVDKVVTLFTAACGLVAALAWDDAVKSLFQRYYPFPGTGIEAKFLYAFSITILFVILSSILAALLSKGEES